MKQWYEKMFENYARTYDQEVFTQGTMGEVDFLEQEFEYDRTKKILDIGCGTGRHAIELAKRGYTVTGIDLSESQLSRAREKAAEAGVQVEFIQQDARKLNFQQEFETVIMLCEGAFSLMETDEMNFQILQGASKALKPKGIFIFTCLNALFPLYHSVKDFINQNAGEVVSSNNTFDLMTFRDYSTATVVDDSRVKQILQCNERYYAPSEISWLLKSLQFRTIDILGAELGQFNREKKLSTEDYEMLVISRKY